jgi:hypothetical protein
MTVLLKAIYMFSSIPTKIPVTLITEIEKSTLKFTWKHKRSDRQGKNEQKRAMLEASQYPTSNYTTEP